MEQALQILKKYWGYSGFKLNQSKIIEAVLNGKDTLGIMPTGGGKSICYQVPAIMLEGICLVFTPLISLIKDQILGLDQIGIPAVSINSSLSAYEVQKNLALIENQKIKFVFVAPERLKSELFLTIIDKIKIGLVVIDEAHCISQWGYDFRPSYLEVANAKSYFKTASILALTASATPKVQEDICNKLLFKTPHIIKDSVVRNNLSISVKPVQSKLATLLIILEKINNCSIIYCKNRGTVNLLSQLLLQHGFSTVAYHAGLDIQERNIAQELWVSGAKQIVCCTNAFGMGINKANVRCVIHFDLPESLEAYYQEIGRAGRDGTKSFAVALIGLKETWDIAYKVEQKYPETSYIFMVYEKLCQYLNINFEDEPEKQFDFDIAKFISDFKLSTIATYSAINLLVLNKLIATTENIFIPSKVQVIANRNDIEFLEINKPNLAHILKSLLRLYGGILNEQISIKEYSVAELAETTAQDILEKLDQLQKLGYINYIPAKDKPQVWLTQSRLRKYDFVLDTELLLFLRQRYNDQLVSMESFSKTTQCRMVNLANYFGETEDKPCGICDNCKQAKTIEINKSSFNAIKEKIISFIKLNPKCTIKQLINYFSGHTKSEVYNILNFLQQEDILTINNSGTIEINE